MDCLQNRAAQGNDKISTNLFHCVEARVSVRNACLAFGDEYTASDSGAGILGSASTNRITTVAKPVHERSGSEVTGRNVAWSIV